MVDTNGVGGAALNYITSNNGQNNRVGVLESENVSASTIHDGFSIFPVAVNEGIF